MATAAKVQPTLNINVGILGHVDAGKTSLVRALSTELSTAALDKHPQSQERGITLDLGFSAFTVDAPPQVAEAGFEKLQFTLVDCPGHASLIRTIIGGASIIDLMILVIDITKGIQTQTAECLVIGEIATDSMIVVLNKADMVPDKPEEGGRQAAIDKAAARIRKVLASTKFAQAPFVVLSAAPGGGGKMGAAAPVVKPEAAAAAAADGAGGVKELVSCMRSKIAVPARDPSGPFLFAIDHCFPIKGQGTVMTGTVLSGSISVGAAIEIPTASAGAITGGGVSSASAETGGSGSSSSSGRPLLKVKSIQMFHRPATTIQQGDRAGICVAGLEASAVERGLACSPATAVPTFSGCIALVKKIRFFKGDVESSVSSKVHVTVGHTTVMASAFFFGAKELAKAKAALTSTSTTAASAKSGSGSGSGAAGAGDADAEAVRIVDEDSTASSSSSSSSSSTSAAILPVTAAGAGGVGGGKDKDKDKGKAGAGAGAGASSSSAGGLAAVAVVSDAARRLAASVDKRTTALGIPSPSTFSLGRPPFDYEWQEKLMYGKGGGGGGSSEGGATSEGLAYEWQWAALLFDSPITAPLSSLLIGSRLDTDLHANTCRLAFYGKVVEPLPLPSSGGDARDLPKAGIHLYKRKVKQGSIDRVEAKGEAAGGAFALSAIGTGLFSKNTDITLFTGLYIHTRYGQVGKIDASFGKTGKFKVFFPDLRKVDVEAAALSAAQDSRLMGGSAPAASASAPGGGGVGASSSGGVFPPQLVSAVQAWNSGKFFTPSQTSKVITLDAPPLAVVKSGEPLFLRFRKYQFGGGGSSTGDKKGGSGGGGGPVLVQ